jgi:chromosome segregation ATPase
MHSLSHPWPPEPPIQITFLESRLAGTREGTEDYDSQLTRLEGELQRAVHAKAAVDEKLANAIKVSERAYASLVAADKQQTELEEEIRRLRALMSASSASTELLNSATTMTAEEREKFRLLVLQVRP